MNPQSVRPADFTDVAANGCSGSTFIQALAVPSRRVWKKRRRKLRMNYLKRTPCQKRPLLVHLSRGLPEKSVACFGGQLIAGGSGDY